MRYASRLTTLLLLWAVASSAQAQSYVLERLDNSPRQQEWVTVQAGDRQVDAFVVFPEGAEKALSVVVIHENWGLSDWVRGVADRLAEAGYIAIAPDLLSGAGPDGGNTQSFASEDDVSLGISRLDPAVVTNDLAAVTAYMRAMPAANGKVAVAGFGWGGEQALRFATNQSDIKAAMVFYGGPPAEGFERIQAPVYGFYGGDDPRINATIPTTATAMRNAGKMYQPMLYPDSGHGFMRDGQDPAGTDPNKRAFEQAWQRWLKILAGL
ncbi:MAG: dienelactone hydrolase family protein [Rhodothermales bacterium]|nr:dienelactone hydrolase family protein [Rhodothermales bacterium]